MQELIGACQSLMIFGRYTENCMHREYSIKGALTAQLGSTLLVVALAFAIARLGIAAIIALRQKAPRWWLTIHLAFAPLAVLVHGLEIEPAWFLTIFIVLLLVFWRTDKSRVPLYLTNHTTAEALAKLIPPGPCRVIDLGCGEGGVLRLLAQARPDCQFVGIEHAPLTCLAAKLRNFYLPNVAIRHGDFWEEPLQAYQLIYAFLSPAPMPRLWKKMAVEIRAGAMFISNSFPVPGIRTHKVIEIADRRATQLYLYLPPDKTGDSVAFPSIPVPGNQE
jgi:SAM-dependent methyltransferase